MKQLLTAILALCLGAPASAVVLNSDSVFSGKKDAGPVEDKFSFAAQLYRIQQYDRAEALFLQVLDMAPNHVQAHLALAETSFQRGDITRAAQYIGEAKNLEPENVDVLNTYGKLQFVLKHYDEAQSAFERAIALDPRRIQPRINLADLYATTQPMNIELQVAAYSDVLHVDPAHRGAQYAMGRLMMKKGDREGAIRYFQEASQDPASPLPQQALGDIYLADRDLVAARSSYAAATEKSAVYVPAWVGLAETYGASSDLDGALSQIERGLAHVPASPLLWYLKGVYAQRAQQDGLAELAYRQAIANADSFAPAYNNLAWLLFLQKRDLAEAKSLAEKAVNLVPGDAEYADTLSRISAAQ